MLVIHEVAPDSVASILSRGLKRAPRGEKGDDSSIAATDKLLDAHRPPQLIKNGVERNRNTYGYYVHDSHMIDITDGSSVKIDAFVRQSERAVLQIRIDPARCYVSDLDVFDEVMKAVQNKADKDTIERLANTYWQSLILLREYQPGDIKRPEVMIPYDVPPDAIMDITQVS